MSVIAPGRLANIHATFRTADCIALNGTIERMAQNGQPLSLREVDGFIRVTAGYKVISMLEFPRVLEKVLSSEIN